MEKISHVKIRNAALSIILTEVYYYLFLISHPLYMHSDNWEVAVVTAGYYGNNYCQYIHPLLCFIIKGVGEVLSSADVFTLLTHLAIGIGIALILYLLLTHFSEILVKKLPDYLILAVILLALFFFTNELRIWNANYNIQTGAVIFFGLIILYCSLYQVRSGWWILAGTALLAFGFMLRVAVTFLFLPYIGLEIITYLLEGRSRQKIIHHIFPVVLVITTLFAVRFAFLSANNTRSEAYNQYRTIMVDYPVKSWHELENPDFSEIDYQAASNWFFADTENMNTELLEKMAAAGQKNAYSFLDIHKILAKMWRTSVKTDVYMALFLVEIALLAIWNILTCKSKWRKAETILSVIGSFVILYYFTFRGRAPLRVWQPVLFAAGTVLISAALQDKKASGKAKTTNEILLLSLFALLWFGAGQMIAHAEFMKPQNVLTARKDIDDSFYEETFEEDAVYIWPNWHATIPKHFMNLGKLPTQRVLDHNIAAGDWTYGQDYYIEHLNRIGVPNPAKALLFRDNTYLMEGNDQIIVDYLSEHYGKKVQLVEVGAIDTLTIYRISR